MKSVNEMSAAEQKRLMDEYKLMKEREEKAKARAKKYREENKEKAAAWSERARVRQILLVKKAKAAGLTVTEAEVDEYLNSK